MADGTVDAAARPTWLKPEGDGTYTADRGRPWAAGLYLPTRYKGLWGGRGSGKTTAFAEAMLERAERDPGRYLCAREFEASITESVHATLEDVILDQRLPGWRVRRHVIEHVRGSRIFFRGLARNLQSIRGFRRAKVCWIDEAQFLRDRTWEVIRNTIREEGSELWLSFNPEEPAGPAYRLITDPPPGTYIAQVNWRDNPYFPAVLDAERQEAIRSDPARYAHVWEGAWDDGGLHRVLPIGVLMRRVRQDAVFPLDERPQIGFDVSGDGRDRGAMVVRRGAVITHIEMLDGDTIPQAKRVHGHAIEIGASVVSVDAGGVGAVAAAWMRGQDFVPYSLDEVLFGDPPAGPRTRYGPKSTNAQQFARRNGQLAWGVRHHVVGDFADLAIADHAVQNIGMEAYLSQLAQPIWKHDAAQRVVIDKGAPSPDAYDATVLAFAPESRRGLRAPGVRSSARLATFTPSR